MLRVIKPNFHWINEIQETFDINEQMTTVFTNKKNKKEPITKFLNIYIMFSNKHEYQEVYGHYFTMSYIKAQVRLQTCKKYFTFKDNILLKTFSETDL